MENELSVRMDRMFRIIGMVESARDGLTVREIHTGLAQAGVVVRERTIYRDLEVLEAAGYPLYDDQDVPEESGKRGQTRWRLMTRKGGRSWLPQQVRRRNAGGY